MSFYIITYNLEQDFSDSQDYKILKEQIENSYKSFYCLKSVWIIKTDLPINQIHKHLQPYVKDIGEILIAKIDNHNIEAYLNDDKSKDFYKILN